MKTPSSFKNQIELEKAYPADKYMHFMPFQNLADTLSPYFKITATVINFDLDPDHSDVYTQEPAGVNKQTGEMFRSAELAFSKGALETLAAAGGIRDVPTGCGVQIRQTKLCTFQATGESRMPDGSYRQVCRQYTVDLELFEDQIRAKKIDQARKIMSGALDWKGPKKEIETLGQDVWIDIKVADAVNQKRSSIDETAETGAKQRMIRAILKVPSKFKTEEMSKPVVVLRVDEDFPVDDPDFKRIIAERGSRSLSSLYPPSPAPATQSRGFDLPRSHHDSGGAPAGGIELSPEVKAEVIEHAVKAEAEPLTGKPLSAEDVNAADFGKTDSKSGSVIDGTPPSRLEIYASYDYATIRAMFIELVQKKTYPPAGELVVKWKATPKSDIKKKAEIIIDLEDWKPPASNGGKDDDLPF